MAPTSSSPIPAASPPGDRARQIVDGLGEGFLSADADWRLTDCNANAERFFKRAREDLLDRELWTITGISSDSPFAALGRRVATKHAGEEAEVTYLGDGRTRVLSVRAFPLGDGVGVVWRDITAARAAERRLALNEARYREVADGVPAAAWLSKANGKLEFVNQAMVDALGRPSRELLGDGWMRAIDPDDRAAFLAARSQAWMSRSTFRYEGRFRRPDGALRIITLYGCPRFDRSGAFCGHVGVANDVTDARATEERQQVLINELNHRVKNALATVQSLVRQTLRQHKVDKGVEAEIAERVLALAAAHDVLTRENWEGAELTDIATDATAAHNHGGRITVEGPKVRLSPKTALALSMALHELATNAVKHGALSNSSGRAQLRWTKRGDRVDLEWREVGGPPVTEPDHLGFGSRLLGQVLAGELGEPAEVAYAPTGLICKIHAPVHAP